MFSITRKTLQLALRAALLAALLMPFNVSTVQAETVEQALEDLYSDDRYQKNPPFEVVTEKVEKKIPEKKEPIEPLNLDWLEVVGKIVFYGLMAILAILLGKALYNYLKDFKKRPQNKARLEDEPTSYSRVSEMAEEVSQETLEYADRLAHQGQYEAAIRAILFCCLKHVKESYHASLPAALTNREILQADWIPSNIRQNLSVIVNAEELTEFGGRSAGEREFSLCREAFHVFISPNSNELKRGAV